MTSRTATGARPSSVRLTGVVGWILLACGAGVLLYLAYAQLFTNAAATVHRAICACVGTGS